MTKLITFFDLETTGLSTATDQIVSFCFIKWNPEDRTRPEIFYRLCKPSIPIPEEASKTHGITDDMVSDKMPFSHYAPQILEMIEGCTIGGQNIIKYDIPLLHYELKRAGFTWNPNLKDVIDTYAAECFLVSRSLSAMYKRYTGEDLEGAHNAAADVDAVIKIIPGMMEAHGLTQIEQLVNVSCHNNSRMVDIDGKLYENEAGIVCMSFGKYKDCGVADVLSKDKGYYDWLAGPKGIQGTQAMDVINNLLNKQNV